MKKPTRKTAMLCGQKDFDAQENQAVSAVLASIAKSDKLLAMGLAQYPKADPILDASFVDSLVSDFRDSLKPPKTPKAISGQRPRKASSE